MPFDKVLPKFKAGNLRSGSKTGPVVKSKDQAVAIMMSEKKKAKRGVKEFAPKESSNKTRSGGMKVGY